MIQLFRERSFGDIFSDTFTFFKQNGKHFFKQYFALNGGLLLLIILLSYVLFDLFKNAFMQGTIGSPENAMENVLLSNMGLVIGVGILLFILFLLISLLNYAFPVIYLGLYETRGKDFGTSDLLKAIWSKLGKIVIFFFAGIFIMGPIFFIVFGLNMLLVFLLIGIPLFLITAPAMVNWVSFTFYEYINTDSGYFDALGTSFRFLKDNFWKFVGVTLLFYIMMQSVLGVLTLVPYSIAIAMTVTDSGFGPSGINATMVIIMVVFVVVTTLLSLILTNFILVSQGMMFYSCKEAEDNVSTSGEIDNIGLHFE